MNTVDYSATLTSSVVFFGSVYQTCHSNIQITIYVWMKYSSIECVFLT